MEVKNIWSDEDFEMMSWHDNYVHSISLPGNDLDLVFDIDYVFESKILDGLIYYFVSPCTLTFSNVMHLKIDLDFGNAPGLDIMELTRSEARLSPNGKINIRTYFIETEKGLISFESTGYTQVVNGKPVFSSSLILSRKNLKHREDQNG